jgi:hypothetical protein
MFGVKMSENRHGGDSVEIVVVKRQRRFGIADTKADARNVVG